MFGKTFIWNLAYLSLFLLLLPQEYHLHQVLVYIKTGSQIVRIWTRDMSGMTLTSRSGVLWSIQCEGLAAVKWRQTGSG